MPGKRYRSDNERISRNYEIDDNGCWIWTSNKSSSGYGRVSSPSGMVLAHRLSYELSKGQIPAGLDLDHLCRVRHCINPDHLEPVTRQENLRRSPLVWGALMSAKTHCAQGHAFTERNTRWTGPKRNWRVCRTCSNAATAASRVRRQQRAAGMKQVAA